jgi:hypothetical protein
MGHKEDTQHGFQEKKLLLEETLMLYMMELSQSPRE